MRRLPPLCPQLATRALVLPLGPMALSLPEPPPQAVSTAAAISVAEPLELALERGQLIRPNAEGLHLVELHREQV